MPADPRTATATVAATKYRVPRLRREAVARPRLLERLAAAARALPLTVVAAPAGYGKTTLLAQLAATLEAEARVAWVSLDADDADAGRWYANFVRACEPLGLTWAEDPRSLVANAAAGGAPARAAVGALVNALCTAPVARLVLVLDDLHRADGAEIPQLLEALVERLPEHVGLVIGTRRVPDALPVARWVVRGEAEEFGAADLGFQPDEARALAGERFGAASDELVERALARAHGWPAGTALLLRAARAGLALNSALPAGDDPAAEHALYEYLAAEVLDHLQPGLREFALDCAVLDVLTPEACATVAGVDDAPARLRALYRLETFVVALDAHGPVLRFHDLFRDFLRNRLQLESPERLRERHRRAARVAAEPAQALAHWAAAGEWEAFVARLVADADGLLAVAGPAGLERWLARVPAPTTATAGDLHYLRGVCAWRRWDWLAARRHLEAAVAADDAAGRPPRTRALLLLMGTRNGLGDRDAAAALGATIAERPLSAGEGAAFALQRAWCAMAVGDPPAVLEAFRDLVARATADPARVCPQTADRGHTAYIGLPGMVAQYEAFLRACRAAEGEAAAPWHAGPRVIEGWTRLWRGDRRGCERALEEVAELQRRFGRIQPIEDAAARLGALVAAIAGRPEGVELGWELVRRFEDPKLASLKQIFERAYVCGVSKALWALDEPEGLRECERRLREPRRPNEWAFIDLARATLGAQVALQDGRLAAAEEGFTAALGMHDRLRFVQGHADPRVGLAYVRLLRGDRAGAWTALAPAIDECLREDVVGPLLCEPPRVREAVMPLIPHDHPAREWLDGLLARLEAWRPATRAAAPAPAPAAGAPVARPAAAGPLALLTEREREVLARVALGDGNKDIARHLDLSLHTVKRHIANLLGKLDCVSRRQAAELYRRHSGF